MRSNSRFAGFIAMTAVALGVAACSDSSNDGSGATGISALVDPTKAYVEVCKYTVTPGTITKIDALTSATVGLSGNGGPIATLLLTSFANDPAVNATRNPCETVEITNAGTLTVTETPGTGSALQTWYTRKDGVTLNQGTYDPASKTPAPIVIADIALGSSYQVWLKNVVVDEPPPPSGGQGCTPGFWKNSTGSWQGYTPNQLFSSVFENAFPGKTLLEVAGLNGGGLNALGRHTVAALLNASASSPDVSYAFTTQQVIDAFNSVYPGGDYEGLKNVFATQNEKGCPLANDNSGR